MSALPKLLYSPIVKAKLGEYMGLFTLDRAVQDAILPLLVLPPFTEYDNEQRKVLTPGEHVKHFGRRLWEYWNRRPILVDGCMIDEDYSAAGVPDHAMIALFQRARTAGATPIPVTGLDRSPAYQEAVRRIVQFDNLGCGLRLTLLDFESADLRNRIDQLMSELRCRPSDTYLYVDLGSRTFDDPVSLVEALVNRINALPYLLDWRTLFLAGTDFPSDLSDIKADQEKTLSRGEWALYKLLSDRAADFGRFPVFADYCIEHPNFPAPGPRRASIHIRYTTDDGYFISKGPSGEGFARIRLACAKVIRSGHFAGDNFCSGDLFISRCASGVGKHRGPSAWREAGTNHHITKVVRELAAKAGILVSVEAVPPDASQPSLFEVVED